jgi:WD40 repeat protein
VLQHTVIVAALEEEAATDDDDGTVTYTELCRFTDDDDARHQPAQTEAVANASVHRIAWSIGPDGEPLLCVAGASSMIKVYDVTRRRLERVLIGCGAALSELRVPRRFPWLLFTAGADREVRVWNLRNVRRPLAAVFAGSGDFGHIYALV